MPRDRNGNNALPPGTLVNSGDMVLPSQHNPAMEDLSAGITGSLSRDGLGGMRAALDMGDNRIANVAPATGPNDALTLGQASPLVVPLGGGCLWWTDTPPVNFMFPRGQYLDRVEYAELFALWGTRFGAGDGSTTFTIPTMGGRVPVMLDGGVNVTPEAGFVGAFFGTREVVLHESQMPVHAHTGTTGATGSHTHFTTTNIRADDIPLTASNAIAVADDAGGDLDYRLSGANPPTVGLTSQSGDHSHGFATDARGGNQPHTNLQPSYALNFIVRVR